MAAARLQLVEPRMHGAVLFFAFYIIAFMNEL